jgi:hypothetical protein
MEAACYGRQVPATLKTGGVASSIWGNETEPRIINSNPLTRTRTTGIVLIRPLTLLDQNKTRPLLLHELLHSYHDRILPGGFTNQAVQSWFKHASEQGLYPADQYLMTNEREFFAVTASVFLSGKDAALVRADIKKKQPDYYTYLKWLFEFDRTLRANRRSRPSGLGVDIDQSFGGCKSLPAAAWLTSMR